MRATASWMLVGIAGISAVIGVTTPALGGGNNGTVCPTNVGPDVIVGDIVSLPANYTAEHPRRRLVRRVFIRCDVVQHRRHERVVAGIHPKPAPCIGQISKIRAAASASRHQLAQTRLPHSTTQCVRLRLQRPGRRHPRRRRSVRFTQRRDRQHHRPAAPGQRHPGFFPTGSRPNHLWKDLHRSPPSREVLEASAPPFLFRRVPVCHTGMMRPGATVQQLLVPSGRHHRQSNEYSAESVDG
jgi:hypothetical protein